MREKIREKRGMIRRISALLVCLFLMAAASGCGTNAGTSGAENRESGGTGAGESGEASLEESGGKGRFLESALTLPEHTSAVLAAAKLDDGTIEIFTWDKAQGAYTIHLSEDGGENFKQKDLDDGKMAEILNGYVSGAAIRSDGTVAGISESEEGAQIFIIRPDGTMEAKAVTLPDADRQEEKYAYSMAGAAFDRDGNFLIENLNSHFYKADLSTGNCELLCELEEHYARYFAVAGNQALAISRDGIFSFDSASGEALGEDAFWNDMIAGNPSLAEKNTDYGAPLAFTEGTEEGMVFYVNHEGLFCHTRGGSVSEQLINGSLTSLGNVSASFIQLIMLDKENFLVFSNGGANAQKLLKYSYDKDASSVPETELKVYALEESDFLRQVITIYQKNHQDVYVNLQIGMSGEDGMTAEDAIRTLNADILAGNGPDVMILDGLPVDSYIEKGMLKDIAPLIKEIETSDGMFANIRQAYEKEGAVYQFPARFYVNLVDGDAKAVEAGAALDKLAAYVVSEKKAAGESHIFPFRGAEDLLEKLYLANSASWMDENGKLKEAELTKFLSSAQQIYSAEPRELGDYDIGGVKSSDLAGSLSAMNILLKAEKISYGTLVNMMGLISVLPVNEQLQLDYALAGRDSEKAFVPYQLAGIHAGTGEEEAAEDFLRSLFGVECNSSDGNGFPVNRSAYEKICEQAQNTYDEFHVGGVSVSTDDGGTTKMKLRNPSEEEIAKLTGILEEVDSPICMDRVIKEIVLSQGKEALLGNSSVEEAAAEILRKCNLYLAE